MTLKELAAAAAAAQEKAWAGMGAKLADEMIKAFYQGAGYAFYQGVAAGRAEGFEVGYAEGRREGLDDNPDRGSSWSPKRKRKVREAKEKPE